MPIAHYMVVGAFELRWYVFPNLGFGTVQVAGFADLGSVAASPSRLLHDNTVSVGPVVRYVTPVGPLSLAYGWPVVLPQGLKGTPNLASPHGRLHFMFGYSY